VKDADWIAQLLEHGLVRPSFVPPPAIRHLRMLTRYRVQLMADRPREMTRLELMLEDASIKLSSVAASLTSVSARAMLAALIAGERARPPRRGLTSPAASPPSVTTSAASCPAVPDGVGCPGRVRLRASCAS
jgi:hypothetical protein